jgi:hypothetical protein
MIFFLIKNWKLLLDIILVVGGIIALTLFDPFGIFTTTKLRGTANLVSSVRNIGELVTAEYYGEVISSLHETYIYDVEPDLVYKQFESCYIALKYILVAEMLDDDEKKFLFVKQKVVNEIQESAEFKELQKNYDSDSAKIFTHLFVFLAVQNLNGKESDYFNENNNTLKKSTVKSVVQLLVDELNIFISKLGVKRDTLNNEDLRDFIFSTPTYISQVSEYHYKLNKDNRMSRKKRKKDIVFIGRGWVKAGFRFGQLDESNFYYDKELKLIRFFGLSPCILDKDINPWFIPERKIKGFELVDFYNKATFEEAKKVKKKCKEKLLDQAKKADILARSKANGEEALTNFFSLLLDEPDLTVELIDFPFESDYQMIVADTLITIDEALSIKTIYEEVLKDTVNLSASEISRKRKVFSMFMNRLMKLSFIDEDVQFNFFSLEAAKVLEHTLFISRSDFNRIKAIRGQLELNDLQQISTTYMKKNQEFINGYTSFTSEFNQMMKLIDNKINEVDSLRADTLSIRLADYRRLGLNDNLVELVEKVIDTDTICKIMHKDVSFKFSDLRYPIVTLNPNDFKDLNLSDTTKVDAKMRRSIIEARSSSGDADMNSIINDELKVIAKYKSDSIKHAIKIGPVRAFTRSVTKLINQN